MEQQLNLREICKSAMQLIQLWLDFQETVSTSKYHQRPLPSICDPRGCHFITHSCV